MTKSDDYPINSARIKGRFVRDPLIGQSDKGRWRVMGRVVTNEVFTDQRGDQQTRRTYVDVQIFDQDAAKRISEAQPKENTVIAVGGYVSRREDQVTDKQTGEVKTFHGIEVTMDGSEGHYAEIVSG